MNGIKIIDRKLLADLAKEVGLNASHLETLGESRQWEIAVDGDMLERLVDIQHRFEQLAAMGDDEYRGFYIEVPRPTPEEWEDAEELIASGDQMVSCCFEPIRGLPVNPCYGPEADMLYHYESPQVYGCRGRWYVVQGESNPPFRLSGTDD